MGKMKKCKKCGIDKPLEEFSFKSDAKDKHTSACKECLKKYLKKYYIYNREKILSTSLNYYKKNTDLCKLYSKDYYKKNKERIKKQQREFFKRNPDYAKKWRDNHNGGSTENYRAYAKIYYKNKRDNDPNYRIANVLRCGLWNIIKRGQKSGKIFKLLSISRDEFLSHLSSQWTDGMNWDNYGMKGWCIDHINPVSNFDLTDENQLKECFHYTNLRPMWFRENCKKNNK